ncbi:MAG: cytochrome c3 family protein [Planctomycetota bacterium]
MTEHTHHPSRMRSTALAASLLFGVLAACHDSNNSSNNNQGPFTPDWPAAETALQRGDATPGMSLEILSVTGGSDANGGFQVGDTVKVTFTVKKNDGTWWRLDELPFARMLVAGPTFNYQLVVAEQRDIATKAVYNGDHTWTYTFPTAIPATYLPPLNDTATFGAADGELQGQALLPGTYTVGFYVGWSYTVDGAAYRDAADATKDFLFGGAATITPRALVGQENCNECHKTLQAHGGLRRSVGLCVLCHTSGSEDRNVATVAGGTPDVTIDFRVMIHKIHNAEHLPSVNGVATNADGSRNYGATPKSYEIVGFNNSLLDFSHVAFPVWPNGIIAMPRDEGYTALTTTQKAQEDLIRRGAAQCSACHGDPDGAGPIEAPAQGGIAFSQPTRRACGACHDDIDWAHPYTANGQTMPAQNDDAACLLCHGDVGTPLHPEVAHTHPLKDPAFNTGTNFTVDSIVEAGTNDADGTFDTGEKVQITFRVKDDSGAEIAAAQIGSMNVVFSGPTTNSNILLSGSIPVAALGATQPFTVLMPQARAYEFIGTSTGAGSETFNTAYTPMWDMTGATTTVYVTTVVGGGGNTTLTAASNGPAYWIEVANVANLARNDWVVIDGGVAGTAEIAQITGITGNRLWFVSPTLSKNHAVGATVQEVTVATKTRTTDYTVAAATGGITEVTEFGAGNWVFCSYTTDYVVPSVFPLPLTDPSPDLDETVGNWAGKPLVDGTYAVTLWGRRDLVLNLYNETQTYRSVTVAQRTELLVGSATTLEPYALIDSGETCNACHKDVAFHGGSRRGFVACIACHGTSGGGDRPQYIAPNAPATDQTTWNFRQFLHRLHMGDELNYASTSWFVRSANTAWPNNYVVSEFAEIGFPVMPSGVKNCAACHGENNTAWHEPSSRNHPTMQGMPVKSWNVVCGACHDSDAARGHISSNTGSNGYEGCATCHGEGREWPVQLVHKIY